MKTKLVLSSFLGLVWVFSACSVDVQDHRAKSYPPGTPGQDSEDIDQEDACRYTFYNPSLDQKMFYNMQDGSFCNQSFESTLAVSFRGPDSAEYAQLQKLILDLGYQETLEDYVDQNDATGLFRHVVEKIKKDEQPFMIFILDQPSKSIVALNLIEVPLSKLRFVLENSLDFKRTGPGPKDPGDKKDDSSDKNKDKDKPAPKKSLSDVLDLVSTEAMKEELSFISLDEFEGRLSATSGNEKVADWLIEQMEELDIPAAPSTSHYRQTFVMPNGPTRGQKTSNIIAYLEGNDPDLKDEHIVLGAHMDHTGSLRLGYTCRAGAGAKTNICNGADDNGSGTISLLNVAKALSEIRHELQRTVVFMWFSGEEEGLNGSYYYTQKPLFPLNKLKYMINMDMVGYMHTNRKTLFALGGETSVKGAKYLRQIHQQYKDQYNLNVTRQAGGGSDHVPFFRKGIPGVFFNTGVNNNPNYHRTSDTADLIYYDGMAHVVRLATELTYKIANDTSFETNKIYSTSAFPFVTKEEEKQSCHQLVRNPFIRDFSKGN